MTNEERNDVLEEAFLALRNIILITVHDRGLRAMVIERMRGRIDAMKRG